jgi:ankyrin repeat protein
MCLESVRQRARAFGIAACALGSLIFTGGADAAPISEDSQAGVRHGWLPALFAPSQKDERQQALAHLEAAGIPLEGENFVQSVRLGHRPLINLFRQAGIDLNTTGREGRTALLTAALQRDWPLFTELLQAGADVNRADTAGLTPLMAVAAADSKEPLTALLQKKAELEAADKHGHRAIHYAVAAGSTAAVSLLLEQGALVEGSCCENRNLAEHAFAGENWTIIEAVLAKEPAPLPWRTTARETLNAALVEQNVPHVQLLLSKHEGAPTPEGRAQPLLAYCVLENNVDVFKTLLAAGADPNTPLGSPVEKVFLESLSGAGYLKHYLDEERGMTTLMLAAGAGKVDFVRALLEKSARRNLTTDKYKMVAMQFAAQTENADIMQMLIGDCPSPEKLRIEISIAAQKATIYKDGSPAISTSVSTGRPGYATSRGRFVVTDKHLSHMSTIFKVPMPFFMRLNCRDFGMHEGVVPGYPASHGCIRVPGDMARRLFKEIPVGTLVTIQ